MGGEVKTNENRSRMTDKPATPPADREQDQRRLQMLFTPIRVGRLELKNRMIMPPMIERLATAVLEAIRR